MRKRKWIAMLFVTVMILTAMSGCAGSGGGSSAGNTDATASPGTSAPSAQTKAEDTVADGTDAQTQGDMAAGEDFSDKEDITVVWVNCYNESGISAWADWVKAQVESKYPL